MKKTKFRAWDTYKNKMITGDLALSTGVICKLLTLPNHNGSWRTEIGECFDGELMQFTGLQDKNGKDIYEGDILNYASRDFAQGLKAIVEWIGSGFYCHGNISISAMLEQQAEIIGNIYENPDLINPK